MKKIKFDYWYRDDNNLSISLLRYNASIQIDFDNNKFLLEVTNSEMKKATFEFDSLEDSINFTETTVSNSDSFKKMITKYREDYIEKEKSKVKQKTML